MTLAEIYESDQYGEQNYSLAVHWMEKAFTMGDPTAAYSLGKYYFEGTVVEKNFEQAKYYLEKSYEFSPCWARDATYLLGKIYFDENYEVFDEIEAYNWFTSCIGMHQKVMRFLIIISLPLILTYTFNLGN